MVSLEKPEPKSVTIIILDRKKNISKSLTVYDATVDQIFSKIKKCLK